MRLQLSDIENLIKRIKLNRADFDFIVGVSRGGLIPAALIATRLDKPLIVVYIDKQNNVYLDREDWVAGKRILLVDDICRTGTTLKTMKALLEKKRAADIKTLTLYLLKQAKFKPDFFAAESNEEIFFPWD